MAKTKRYADGGMEDNGEEESLTGADRDYGGSSGSGEYAPEPEKKAKPASRVVTKEELEKSGYTNLRDFLNAERGLKRRDGSAPAAPKVEAPKVEAPKAKSSYETPYDRMNRQTSEASAAKREAEKEVANLRSRHPAPGRGRIDTSNINPKTLLPNKMAKGGMTASKRADGIAQKGKTRCKTY